MASVNKVILIGNVGKDPEIRYMQSGEPIANFSLATNEVWNDKSGQRQERTEWHRVEVFGKTAQVVRDYVTKGKPIYIEGSIRYDEWTDKDGEVHEGPMTIGRFYTASLSEKATLRRDLENWRGKSFTKEELAGFDLFKILGTACQIMVAHNTSDGKTYANITGIMGLKKGDQRPAAENKLVKYSPSEQEMFDDLPKWLQEKVNASGSAAEVEAAPAAAEDFDDDIPF